MSKLLKKRIIVSSINPQLYTTVRLLSEAKKLKLSPIYLNPYNYQINFDEKKTFGVFIHRTTGTNYDDFDLAVAKHHSNLGHQIVNPLDSLKTFRSKDLQSLFFNEHKLASIKTILFRGEMSAELENNILNVTPDQKFILKMCRGNQGIGVNYLESLKSLLSVLETFHAMKDQRFLIQPYILHKKEWRVFIIENEIIACIEKTLTKDNFRGNAKRSFGKLLVKLPKGLEELSQRAFKLSGLNYAGIDILQSDAGELMLLEINAIPGFEQAEELSKKNIAREILLKILSKS
jgi:RimK family alpha-L-glutamate ligase